MKENTQLLQDDPDKMVSEELAKYKMISSQVTSGFDPLEWWGQHSQTLPILAGVSCNIFAITATSSESERHFSLHKTVFSARRSTLSPKDVEALVHIEDRKNCIRLTMITYTAVVSQPIWLLALSNISDQS